jgi:hypothetical protein
MQDVGHNVMKQVQLVFEVHEWAEIGSSLAGFARPQRIQSDQILFNPIS